jgi:hypothetical protein
MSGQYVSSQDMSELERVFGSEHGVFVDGWQGVAPRHVGGSGLAP